MATIFKLGKFEALESSVTLKILSQQSHLIFLWFLLFMGNFWKYYQIEAFHKIFQQFLICIKPWLFDYNLLDIIRQSIFRTLFFLEEWQSVGHYCSCNILLILRLIWAREQIFQRKSNYLQYELEFKQIEWLEFWSNCGQTLVNYSTI